MALSRKERERLSRESDIISAAESFFITKGFENTTMDDIAKSAEFTKRTVYQYFVSKENLFYAVIIRRVNELFSNVTNSISGQKTGIENIKAIRTSLFDFVKTHPDIYRLMNYAQYISSDPESIPNYKELAKLNIELFSLFHRVIEQGTKDGSIRSDFKIPIGIFSLFFITTGFINRVSESGETYSKRFGFSTEELVTFTFDMLDSFIKASN